MKLIDNAEGMPLQREEGSTRASDLRASECARERETAHRCGKGGDAGGSTGGPGKRSAGRGQGVFVPLGYSQIPTHLSHVSLTDCARVALLHH
jgi:hypothetical protein